MKVKAVWFGRPLGYIFPNDVERVPEGMREWDNAASEPLGDDCCIVSAVRNGLAESVAAATGLCGNCRIDLAEIDALLHSIVGGKAGPETPDMLGKRARELSVRRHCGAVPKILGPLRSSLEFFLPEYASHIYDRNCPARQCAGLIPAPCRSFCPADIDIPGYLALAAQGRYGEALDLIREDNPLPWICGLICPHPCETACIRGKLDEAVNIRYLKAFVAEQAEKTSGFLHCWAASELNGRKVAIAGSGPAGLSSACYLARMGFGVTIFEALPVAGGLLVYGIPEYRLPRSIVRKEIEWILSLGVEIRTGVAIGRDITVERLRNEGYDAFVLAIGAHRGLRLGISGEGDSSPVYDAISFLREVNSGNRTVPGERVVVVGGGNSAMDAARTCLRLGCREVRLAYRRTRAEMPANPHEVVEAMEEGVIFHFLSVPVRVGGDAGRVGYLECLRAELGEPDAGGRRRPVPVEGSNFRLEADAIIAAIGQEPDVDRFPDLDVSRRNLVLTKVPSTRTNIPDIFAAGDVVTGPATVVRAIAGGKQAALDVARYLGRDGDRSYLHLSRKKGPEKVSAIPAMEKIASRRVPMRLVPVETRKRNFEPVEEALSEREALEEARRCLRCDLCVRCGTCEKVCREEMGIDALSFVEIGQGERILSDYMRPAERCIGCGACALSCPTGAMQIVDFRGRRDLRLCGTILNSMEVLRCRRCGEAFVPERYLEFVRNSDLKTGKPVMRELCPECARIAGAERLICEGRPENA